MSWFTELMKVGAKKDVVKPTAIEPQSQTKIKAKPRTVAVDLVNSEHLFYDLLFGKEASSIEIENELEEQVVQRVTDVLLDPGQMEIEPFPKPLKDALDKIDSDAPIDQIQQCLERDPMMAANVVRLANTAAFKRSTKDVTNLKIAINFIGLASLKQIVTAASMNQVMNVSPIYFKMFGEKVWQHSVFTAQICEAAAKEQGSDPYTAFFVGLIHDIGKIVIFKALVEELKQAMPGIQPGSISFRKTMTSIAKQLTLNIVKEWQLPQEVIEPLQQHVSYEKMTDVNPLTKILVESMLLSELKLLYRAKKISESDAEMVLMNNKVDISKIEIITASD